MALNRPLLNASAGERDLLRDALKRILAARAEVSLAFLFGSFAAGQPFHDIDIGIVTAPGAVAAADAFEFVSQLATELEWDVRRPVDLSVLNWAPIALRYHAAQGEALVCRDEEAMYRFIEAAYRDYLDFEPFLRASLRDLLAPDHRPAAGRD